MVESFSWFHVRTMVSMIPGEGFDWLSTGQVLNTEPISRGLCAGLGHRAQTCGH